MQTLSSSSSDNVKIYWIGLKTVSKDKKNVSNYQEDISIPIPAPIWMPCDCCRILQGWP